MLLGLELLQDLSQYAAPLVGQARHWLLGGRLGIDGRIAAVSQHLAGG